MSALKEYLEASAKMMAQVQPDSFQAYVLREGRPFELAALSADELEYVLEATQGCVFPVKECFANSQRALLSCDPDERFTYVEGFCLHLIPVMHGWLEIGGKVVDLTLRADPPFQRKRLRNRVLGEWRDGREYFGMRFGREYVRRQVVTSGTYHTLIDDWANRWPLLDLGERLR